MSRDNTFLKLVLELKGRAKERYQDMGLASGTHQVGLLIKGACSIPLLGDVMFLTKIRNPELKQSATTAALQPREPQSN